MTVLDFILIIPVIYFCYKGILKGFVKRLLAIFGLILGVFVAYVYNGLFNEFISEFWQHSSVQYLAYLLPFIIVIFLMRLIAIVITKGLKVIALSPLNMLFGALFGILQGAIISTVITIILISVNSLIDSPLKSLIQNSLLITYFKTPLDGLLELLVVGI